MASRHLFWKTFEDGQTKNTPIKWLWQRLSRGYDDRDVWDLDEAIVRFVSPRLDHFAEWQQEHGFHYPEGSDPAAWLLSVKKMNVAFGLIKSHQKEVPPQDLSAKDAWIARIDKEDAEIKEGLGLFGKHLQDLYDGPPSK